MKVFKNILFYIASFTWGIIMSLVGLLIILTLMAAGYKVKTFNSRLYIEIGKNWGGCEFGCVFLCSEGSSLSLKQHECGHGIQNIILGPFIIFLVSIPSMVRYWLRETSKKWQFAIMTCTIMLLASLLFLVPGLIAGLLWLEILGGIFTGYTVMFSLWLLTTETPLYYISGCYPDYDDVWFEGTASRWGAKLFPEDVK